MKSLRTFLLFLIVAFISGCSHYGHYTIITGKVLDNSSGKPIEGALVVAQWTKKHGFGLTYHDLSLITESLTDKEGVFSITKTPSDPYVEPPEMIIYKEGYIPWRNDLIFPSLNKVKDNEWKNDVTYKLDVITNKHTALQISYFLDYGMMGRGRAEVPKFNEIKRKLP